MMPRKCCKLSSEEAMQIRLQNWLLAVLPRKLFCFQEPFKGWHNGCSLWQSAGCWLGLAWCQFPVQKLPSDSLKSAGRPQRTQIRRLDTRSSRHHSDVNDVNDVNYDVCTAMPSDDTCDERRFSLLPQLSMAFHF